MAESGKVASAIVVDDEEDIRLALRDLLQEHLPQVAVATAASGPDALDMMRRTTFDLVVADYRMPVMDGLELLANVVARSPRTSRILMTAYADLDLAIRSVNESHVDFFLRKPAEAEAVLDAVSRALAKSLDEQARDRVFARQFEVGREAKRLLHAQPPLV